jgi:hypothetical protein
VLALFPAHEFQWASQTFFNSINYVPRFLVILQASFVGNVEWIPMELRMQVMDSLNQESSLK